MQARILFLIGLFLTQTGHSWSLKPAHPTKPNPPRPSMTSLPAFTAVDITGNINVNLHTGYNKPAVTVMGPPEELKKIKLKVVDGVLYLSLKEEGRHRCCTSVSADIRSRYLNGLVFHGKGIINGSHLKANLERVIIDNPKSTTLNGRIRLGYIELLGKGYTQITGVMSPHLHVQLSGESKLRLTGIASLKHLVLKDKSWFSLSWVKSTSLIICASNESYVELAGIVNKLDAQLWNAAQMNARFLRARIAYVKTHDNSLASIAVTQHQHTLATDASDIQFYNLPEMKTDFMAYEGAVLDMRAFNTPFVEEPTPYNIS